MLSIKSKVCSSQPNLNDLVIPNQLKYVFRLEENVSRAVGQNSLKAGSYVAFLPCRMQLRQ